MQTLIIILVVVFVIDIIGINININYDVEYEDHDLRPIADEDIPKRANLVASTTVKRDFIYALEPLRADKYCYIEDERIHVVLSDSSKMSFGRFEAHIVPNPRGSQPKLLNEIETKTVSLFGFTLRKSTKIDKIILSPNVAFSEEDEYTVAISLSHFEAARDYFANKLRVSEYKEAQDDVVYYRVINRAHIPGESHPDGGSFVTTVCEVDSENGIEGKYDNTVFVYSEEMYKACRPGDVIFLSSDGNWHF